MDDPRDDETLARLAAAGDRGAFGAIVRRHGGRVYGLVRKRCRGAADADDVFQAAMVRAWTRIDRFDAGRGPLAVWLLVVAGRVAQNAAREARGGPRRVGLDGAEVAAPAGRPGERTTGIWGVVERELSAEAGSALWLRYGEGLTPSQIAAALGRTPVGVRVMLLRSLRRLRGALEREGVVADGGRIDVAAALGAA